MDGPLRVRLTIIITFRKILFRGILDEEDDWKKRKIWRGWGAYEEEEGIGARKNGCEGEETGGEKMYRGLKKGLHRSTLD
jgi:hypothetical protein